jgi:hypothetical protein
MNSRPTVAMNNSGMNFSTVVTTWAAAKFRSPDRLTSAGSHSPIMAMTMDQDLACPLFQNTSTYPTQATTIAALPAHAVIQ